jgi:hypothetical protein
MKIINLFLSVLLLVFSFLKTETQKMVLLHIRLHTVKIQSAEGFTTRKFVKE